MSVLEEESLPLQLPSNVSQYVEHLGSLPEVKEGILRHKQADEASTSGRGSIKDSAPFHLGHGRRPIPGRPFLWCQPHVNGL